MSQRFRLADCCGAGGGVGFGGTGLSKKERSQVAEVSVCWWSGEEGKVLLLDMPGNDTEEESVDIGRGGGCMVGCSGTPNVDVGRGGGDGADLRLAREEKSMPVKSIVVGRDAGGGCEGVGPQRELRELKLVPESCEKSVDIGRAGGGIVGWGGGGDAK